MLMLPVVIIYVYCILKQNKLTDRYIDPSMNLQVEFSGDISIFPKVYTSLYNTSRSSYTGK